MHPQKWVMLWRKKCQKKIKLSLPAFYGQKAGMTRIFDEAGKHVPVTVVKLIPNVISQVKTKEKMAMKLIKLLMVKREKSLVNKPKKGHLKKLVLIKLFARFAEIKTDEVNADNLGKEVSVEDFEANTFVDVTGTSKGKGFAGVMKRHNFGGGPAAHGSKFHRTGGSIGNRATPGRVLSKRKCQVIWVLN